MTCNVLNSKGRHLRLETGAYWFEDPLVVLVRDSLSKRKVTSIALSFSTSHVLMWEYIIVVKDEAQLWISTYPQISGAREKFSVFMKAHGQDTVRRVKCFFDPVPVVNVNVDIKHALMIS
jgi:hypothetical protein